MGFLSFCHRCAPLISAVHPPARASLCVAHQELMKSVARSAVTTVARDDEAHRFRAGCGYQSPCVDPMETRSVMDERPACFDAWSAVRILHRQVGSGPYGLLVTFAKMFSLSLLPQ